SRVCRPVQTFVRGIARPATTAGRSSTGLWPESSAPVTGRRLYLPAEALDKNELTLDAHASRYLGRVLRLEPGDRLRVFDGQGREREAGLAGLSPSGAVQLELGEFASAAGPAEPPLTLLLGLAKGDKTDRVVRAVTELGVEAIVPVAMRRSVIQLE